MVFFMGHQYSSYLYYLFDHIFKMAEMFKIVNNTEIQCVRGDSKIQKIKTNFSAVEMLIYSLNYHYQ